MLTTETDVGALLCALLAGTGRLTLSGGFGVFGGRGFDRALAILLFRFGLMFLCWPLMSRAARPKNAIASRTPNVRIGFGLNFITLMMFLCISVLTSIVVIDLLFRFRLDFIVLCCSNLRVGRLRIGDEDDRRNCLPVDRLNPEAEDHETRSQVAVVASRRCRAVL